MFMYLACCPAEACPSHSTLMALFLLCAKLFSLMMYPCMSMKCTVHRFVVQNWLHRHVLLLLSSLCWASVWMILHKARPSPSWLCHPCGLLCCHAKCMQYQSMFSIYLWYLLTGWGACWWCAEGTWGAFLISSSRLSQPWGHVCTGWLSLQQNGVSVRCYAGTSSLPPVSWDNKTYQNILISTSVALNRKS